MMSRLRDAVGGRWGTSLRTWALLSVPAVLPVIVQESLVSRFSLTLVVVTAVAQHLASAVPIAIADRMRRGRATIPVGAFLAVWFVVAVVRGATGGLVEFSLLGTSPEFGYRIAFWLGITWIWVPVFVFVQTRFEVRRQLELDAATALEKRDAARRDRDAVEATLRDELMTTVYATVIPVIDDIRSGLRLAEGSIDAESRLAIGERLAIVTDEASRIVAGAPPVSRPAVTPDPPRPPLLRSLVETGQSPLVTAGFTAVLLAAVIVPASSISPRPENGVEAFGATLVSSILLAFFLFIGGRLFSRRPRARGLWAAGSSLVAGAAGSVVLAWPIAGGQDDGLGILSATFPLTVLTASIIVTTASALAKSNDIARSRLAELTAETLEIERSSDEIEARVRAQLTTVLHGPVYGRLSACVMALNFSASERFSPGSDRGRMIIAGILEHLDSASSDLEAFRNHSPA